MQARQMRDHTEIPHVTTVLWRKPRCIFAITDPSDGPRIAGPDGEP